MSIKAYVNGIKRDTTVPEISTGHGEVPTPYYRSSGSGADTILGMLKIMPQYLTSEATMFGLQ
jgi:hypothetical protein